MTMNGVPTLQCSPHNASVLRFLGAVVALSFCSVPLAASGEAESPNSLRQAIDAQHPGVPWIDTATLAQWLTQPQGRQVVLLDVREVAEFDVSHLRGARRVSPEAREMAALRLPRTATIIVYCSVGYRSAALGQRLRAAGYQQVYNLQGGIFQWANEGRSLHRGSTSVNQVHPYDREWGRLLLERYRSPL